MTFKADIPISAPSDSTQFKSVKDLNGFGWDPDQGLFIPTDGPLEYAQKPLITAAFQKIPR